MEIHTIIRVAVQKDGPGVLVTTEKAFQDQNQARAYLKTVPAVWQEVIAGMECACERAIFTNNVE